RSHAMDDKQIYRSIKLRNFLSYGPAGVELELGPLNVLIGQNASGKSNLIQAFKLIRAMPRSFAGIVYEGGGVREYLYKGEKTELAELSIVVNDMVNDDVLRHSIGFGPNGQQLWMQEERIESLRTDDRKNTPEYYYEHKRGVFNLMARSRAVRIRKGAR